MRSSPANYPFGCKAVLRQCFASFGYCGPISLLLIEMIMKQFLALLLLCLLGLSSSLMACTIVSAALKGEVFAASNEDDYTPFSRVWFNPATPGRYGSVCFGHPDLQAQAAVNEYGLFFDFTQQNIDPSKYRVASPYPGDLFFDLLGQCKTVPEALAFLQAHPYANPAQALLADTQGNSVIINAGAQVVKQGHYQINTNFNVCDLKTGAYSCQRYDIANELLAQTPKLSVPFFEQLLSRVRQEGSLSTQYSLICDLKRGLIRVYNFHDFTHGYTIDIKQELKKGYRLQKVAQLFPLSFAYESYTKTSPLYRKEQLLDQVEAVGFAQALRPYLEESRRLTRRDTALVPAAVEVALQLIKNAWNQHQQGQMWTYWFSLPAGFQAPRLQDPRIEQARTLLQALRTDALTDAKLRHFLAEIHAYTYLLNGEVPQARALYRLAIAEPAQTFPVSYNRAKSMLERL